MASFARRVMLAYQSAYDARPKTTAAVTAFALAGIGDIVAQTVVEGAELRDINWRRFFALASASVAYSTVVYVPFLRLTSKYLGEGTFRSIAGKTILDNFVFTPVIYFPWFYYWTGLVKGHTVEQSTHELRSRFKESFTACCAMWVPGQIINFWLVPPQMRILFIYGIELAWSVTISFISNKAHNEGAAVDAEAGGGPVSAASPVARPPRPPVQSFLPEWGDAAVDDGAGAAACTGVTVEELEGERRDRA